MTDEDTVDSARVPTTRETYLLQEMQGLRTELIGHQTARYNVDQFGLAAIIAIYAWIISTGTMGALVLPPVVAFIALLRQTTIAFSIKQIAKYTAEVEAELAGGGWETWLETHIMPRRITKLSHGVWFLVVVVTTALAIAEFDGAGLLDAVRSTPDAH